MKKSKIFLICMGMALLTACAEKAETSEEQTTVAEINVETESTADRSTAEDSAAESEENATEAASEETKMETEQEQAYEYPSEDAGSVEEKSRLGYSMMFDPTVFTLDDTADGLDAYTYHTSEELDGSAYFTVQSYPDMDAQTLAEGIALQSGQDGVAVQDTFFGADGLETKCVYYEEEAGGVTQVHTFYAVPKEEGSLLVEITGYINMPEQIQTKFEEMAGTFTLS